MDSDGRFDIAGIQWLESRKVHSPSDFIIPILCSFTFYSRILITIFRGTCLCGSWND